MTDDNLFCTLAVGPQYRELAAFLCADLAAYDQQLLIATDEPSYFATLDNAVLIEHRPKTFSYHDKKVALRAALQRSNTAIFVDADTCIHFWADRRFVRRALKSRFSAGLHAWRLYPEGIWEYPAVESFARARGWEFQRNVITYSEGLFALSAHPKMSCFFKIWDELHEEANRRGHNGGGEGTCFGIAAEASGLPRLYTNEMTASALPFLLWHTRLSLRRRKFHHAAFVVREALRGNLNLRMHAWSLT